MAFVIGLHGNVCYPNNTGQVTFMSNLSCCFVKNFVHMTHWLDARDSNSYFAHHNCYTLVVF